MLDPKFIKENPQKVKEALRNRNDKEELVERFIGLDTERRKLISETEDLKRRKNEASQKIGKLIKEGKDAAAAKAEVGKISDRIKDLDGKLETIENRYRGILDIIPNVPHESVPVGVSEKDNKVVKECGDIPEYKFKPKDHLELGNVNGLFDLERGAKISGSAFPMYTGAGAKLERALINFMLDVHTEEHGYKEVFPPYLVNRNSMYGTGQVPKLEDDMYRVKDEDLFLIPTAEVPVTNMRAGEVLKEEEMPLYYTAYTACFRREAGSYGKDTKGLIRVHQFDKVEMVKFTTPESSMDELEKLLLDAEDILKRLELPYRVIELCTADISFAAHKCYDIELWAPGSGRWLEVSSCSVFADFQARRANIKYQPTDKKEKPRFVHTLNGSGVALPRLVIALLEVHQNDDGSINIPAALKGHYGREKIFPSKK